MTNPDQPTRKPRAKRAATAPKTDESKTPVISAFTLAQAAQGTKPVTSMALAQAEPVDTDRYSARERSAAQTVHAMDYGLNRNATDALSFVDATGWPGFQSLALLAQLPEYRSMHETLADETVRTWGKITSTSEDDEATDKITKLTQALERYKIRSLIRQVTIHDQAFGGAHVFPRLKNAGTDLPADTPLLLDPAFVKQGCLESFVAVEPLWVTPNAYNATDPTKPNFYKPSSWYMLATVVDATRLYTVISRPVSDMLKAAYSFRGVSMSQLAMPYVDNWLRTRQSVSDTVKQFSVTYLAADLSQMLQPGGAYSLMDRAQLFNVYRDNRNLALIDKTQEEFGQVNTPLSGLDNLQAQAQEQMAAVSHIPLVKLTGITPAGLNANSDGEIRVWYDYVAGYQSHNLTPLMQWILQLMQLSLFGKIDSGLSWDWNPLYELDDKELAEVRYKNADTDRILIESQVIDGKMAQQRLAADPTSGYSSIIGERDDLDDVETLAERILEESLTPQPQQEPTNDPDADQPDPEAAPAGGNQSGSNR
jgi:phage-related protein (TIGR01555 family)